ncbi:MAG TPA: Mur ligase domain-containing protein [Candidatus Saccharimonadales bacterium]
MRIYFSGIGGVGIGPLAEIALDAGYSIVGSDISASAMTRQLDARGISISDDQSGAFLQAEHEGESIDWYVYTSSLPSDHPELLKARELGIKIAKRDELLARIITEKNLKLIAVAGTHGKTTTTGMIVWLAHYFNIPISYSVGSTLTWGPSGRYTPGSEYFVYECDEFDRNFLGFHPFVSLITSIEHDHPDTYPTEDNYFDAFKQFGEQSEHIITWKEHSQLFSGEKSTLVDTISPMLTLRGEHNRANASLVLAALERFGLNAKYAADGLNKFPGTGRRFEKLAENLYTDYGHTPSEIKATLQLAREVSDQVVLVYQPHQNVRQHEIYEQYTDEIFSGAGKVYWVPTYQSRENEELEILTPEQLTKSLDRSKIHIVDLDDTLWENIQRSLEDNKLVLCMGAGSIDGWVRGLLKS